MAFSTDFLEILAVAVLLFPFLASAVISAVTGKSEPSSVLASVTLLSSLGLLFSFVLLQYKGSTYTFATIFFHLWIICIFWNFTDLIIVDWLFICLLNCKYFVLPGTEDCEGNKNYFFHFIGFLKGAVAMTVVALIFSAIAYFILRMF